MEIMYRGKWMELVNDDGWEYSRRVIGKTAVIIPAMVGDNYIFVEQYRKPLQANCIEWAAGLVGDHDENESAEVAGLRELVEETGYEAVDHFYMDNPMVSSPGGSSEKIFFLLCPNCKKIAEGGGVSGEDITTHIVPKGEVVEWMEAKAHEGVVLDSKIYSGLQLLQIYC